MANGAEITNTGEKRFIAHMLRVDGTDSGPRGVTAQVCDVHRPLMSVKRVCKNGNRVVFDDDGSYVENKRTGEKIVIEEDDGDYVLDVWVKLGKEEEPPFGGQVKST